MLNIILPSGARYGTEDSMSQIRQGEPNQIPVPDGPVVGLATGPAQFRVPTDEELNRAVAHRPENHTGGLEKARTVAIVATELERAVADSLRYRGAVEAVPKLRAELDALIGDAGKKRRART